jgi:hypothetical protein
LEGGVRIEALADPAFGFEGGEVFGILVLEVSS